MGNKNQQKSGNWSYLQPQLFSPIDLAIKTAQARTKESVSENTIPYQIKSGDTAWDLAKDYNVTLEQLQKVNPNIKDLSKINEGQEIQIPIYLPSYNLSKRLKNAKEIALPAMRQAIRNLSRFGNAPDSDRVVKIPENTRNEVIAATRYMLQDTLKKVGAKNLSEYWELRPNETELKLSFGNRNAGWYEDPKNPNDSIYLSELKTQPNYYAFKEKINGNNYGNFLTKYRTGKFDATIHKNGNVTVLDDYDFDLLKSDNPGVIRRIIQGIMGPSRLFTQTTNFPVSKIE